MIYENYTHMKCNCGGIIGMRDKENFSCDKCGKVYRIWSGYDLLMTNEKTGWIFPMVKKEELMKVWITKYALTRGIIEADAEVGGFDTITATWDNGTRCDNFKSEEWWNQKKNAIEKAEEMRQEKIASLKKQIDKFEEMRFE